MVQEPRTEAGYGGRGEGNRIRIVATLLLLGLLTVVGISFVRGFDDLLSGFGFTESQTTPASVASKDGTAESASPASASPESTPAENIATVESTTVGSQTAVQASPTATVQIPTPPPVPAIDLVSAWEDAEFFYRGSEWQDTFERLIILFRQDEEFKRRACCKRGDRD